MYEALILISEANDPAVELYAQEIISFYESTPGKRPDVVIKGGSFSVVFKHIKFRINKNCKPYVSTESKEIASYAATDIRDEISKSKCRFELSSTDDPNMDYFNDYVFLIEAAERIATVWVFSPLDGKFIN